jgi:hypothetical protein
MQIFGGFFFGGAWAYAEWGGVSHHSNHVHHIKSQFRQARVGAAPIHP